MSSFKEFKSNTKANNMFKFIKKLVSPIGNNIYILFIVSTIVFLYLIIINTSYEAKCDKVVSLKKSKYSNYVYVSSDDKYDSRDSSNSTKIGEVIQIDVDSTEYANVIIDYKENPEGTIFCYEKSNYIYWFYVAMFIINIIFTIIATGYKFKWFEDSRSSYY